jgi:hypothetical protein
MQEKSGTEKPTLNLAPIGKSGTLVTANNVDNEYLNELQGEKAQHIYDKMIRSDSQIRKVYHAVNNPIKSAKWDIEPASSSPQDIEVAAKIKHIIFNNIPDGFKAKLDEILTFIWQGHAVFEIVHKNITDKEFGSYTGLASLGFRDQRTLAFWKYENDSLKEINQIQSGDLAVNVWMPKETLLIFYNEKKGNDNGFAFCRMLYGNYKRKLLYKQLQAIGIERAALPVPTLKVPASVSPESDEWTLAEDQLKSFSLAETSYFMYPDGYELIINPTSTFDPSKVQSAIKAENEEIVGALVAMFLEMGIGGNSGNQAGTEVSAGFFRDGIKYLADKVCETINLNLIEQLVALNYGDVVTVMPKLTYAGIGDQAGKELMDIVTGYTKAGVVTVDEPLEDWVRKQHDLPKKAAGEVIDNGNTQVDNTPPSNTSNDPTPPDTTKEVNLSEGGNDPIVLLMSNQAGKITESIKTSLKFSGKKFIADTMNRYRQLSKDKKQSATTKVVMGGSAKFKDALKANFVETMNLSMASATKEISKPKEIRLSSSEFDMKRIFETYGDFSEVKLNELSKYPTHIQVLMAKQADLISKASLEELQKKLEFTFSGIELKSNDEDVIEQNMDETLDDFVESNTVSIKGENAAALMTNEGRNSVFFDPENEDNIHSYTFMNSAPKSPICIELAGTTFNTNDAESLRYSPPLHHNCKSYLRANLSASKGVEKLSVSTLNPSPDAIKSMTL